MTWRERAAETRRLRRVLRDARLEGAADPVAEAARRLRISASLRARYAADAELREARAAQLAEARAMIGRAE